MHDYFNPNYQQPQLPTTTLSSHQEQLQLGCTILIDILKSTSTTEINALLVKLYEETFEDAEVVRNLWQYLTKPDAWDLKVEQFKNGVYDERELTLLPPHILMYITVSIKTLTNVGSGMVAQWQMQQPYRMVIMEFLSTQLEGDYTELMKTLIFLDMEIIVNHKNETAFLARLLDNVDEFLPKWELLELGDLRKANLQKLK